MSSPKICLLFCKGDKCNYCNPARHYRPHQMVVPGLYSSWITDDILATSRPTSKLIETYDIISSFKDLKIAALFNMQKPGEHAFCGGGLESSGFSYDPEVFMRSGIYYYNFCWKDFGAGSLMYILNSIKVIQFALQRGKIAVHCHAGLGRTGTVIACFLIYRDRLSATAAIHFVRSRRPKSIQSGLQLKMILKFSCFLRSMRTIYFKSSFPSYSEFLNKQTSMLHGFESGHLRNIPKIVYVCLRLLVIHAHRDDLNGFIPKEEILCPEDPFNHEPFDTIFRRKDITALNVIQKDTDFSRVLSLDNTVIPQIEKQKVINAILFLEKSYDVQHQVKKWKHRFNETDSAWEDIGVVESNPVIVVHLLYDWFGSIKPSVIGEYEWKELVKFNQGESAIFCLAKVSKPVSVLLRTLARFIFYLRPLPSFVETAVIETLIARFMQIHTDSHKIFHAEKKLPRLVSKAAQCIPLIQHLVEQLS